MEIENGGMYYVLTINRLVVFVLLLVLFSLLLTSCAEERNDEEQDTNVYLGEEACFAGEIYIKVTKMNYSIDNSDGYTLHLELEIEQRNEDRYKNIVTISPKMFKLKSSNARLEVAQRVFIESIVAAGIDAGVSVIFGETPTPLDTFVAAAEHYVDNIREIVNTKGKAFKDVQLSDDSFLPIEIWKTEGVSKIDIVFVISEEVLNSQSLVVLAIDDRYHWERAIFLIPRPEGNVI